MEHCRLTAGRGSTCRNSRTKATRANRRPDGHSWRGCALGDVTPFAVCPAPRAAWGRRNTPVGPTRLAGGRPLFYSERLYPDACSRSRIHPANAFSGASVLSIALQQDLPGSLSCSPLAPSGVVRGAANGRLLFGERIFGTFLRALILYAERLGTPRLRWMECSLMVRELGVVRIFAFSSDSAGRTRDPNTEKGARSYRDHSAWYLDTRRDRL